MNYNVFYLAFADEYRMTIELNNMPPFLHPFNNDFDDEQYKEIEIETDAFYDDETGEWDEDGIRSAAEKAVKERFGNDCTIKW